MSADFRDALNQLRQGRTTFDQFARDTAIVRRRFAAYLMRRWRTPLAVSCEDVEQEILLATWRAVQTFDESRGVAIDGYVTFNALDKAKKWMHKQRSAGHDGDMAKGRMHVTFTELGCETADDEDRIAGRVQWVDTAEEMLAQREQVEEVSRQLLAASEELGRQDQECVAAIAACGGDLEAATDLILVEPARRMAVWVETDAAVQAAVKRAARKVAQKLTQITGGSETCST